MVRIEIPNIDFSVYDIANAYGVDKNLTNGDESAIDFYYPTSTGIVNVEVVKTACAKYEVVDSDILDLILGTFILMYNMSNNSEDDSENDLANLLPVETWPFSPIITHSAKDNPFGVTADNVFVAPSRLAPNESPTLDCESFFKEMAKTILGPKIKRLNLSRFTPNIRSEFNAHFQRVINTVVKSLFNTTPSFSYELNDNSISIKTAGGMVWTFSTMGIFNEPASKKPVFAKLEPSSESGEYLTLDSCFAIIGGKNYLA